jgi:hypothetical protein
MNLYYSSKLTIDENKYLVRLSMIKSNELNKGWTDG